MSRIVKFLAAGALIAGLSACGKDDATPTNTTATSTAPTTTTSTTTTQPVATVKPEVVKDVTYRPLNARLRDSGEQIVIMVPDDMDIESGRMLEYRQSDDGTYYLKSVIPQ